MVSARGMRAAELPAGARRPGRLVRGVGGAGGRADAAAGLFDAEHGEWSGVPSRVSPGDTAGLPGRPRVRLPFFSGRFSAASLRQLESRGEEDPAWLSARGDRALHRLPLALALRSEFCSPYEAHEKGGIESEAGYFRRNHWVPMPKARDLADLNAQLLAACREDERRQIAGHSQPVGAR